MYWIIYTLSSVLLSMLIAKKVEKFFFEVFFSLTVILLTPAKIGVLKFDYAPALYTFFFNILFQEEFSTRALRPLMLSLPLCFLIIFLSRFIKKRLS